MISKFIGSKLDYGLFIGFVIVFSSFVIGLLIYMQFFWKGPSIDDVIIQDEKPRFYAKIEKFPLKLYVAGKVDPSRLNHVKAALKNWEVATGGMAKVELIPDWIPPTRFNLSMYKHFELKTLWFLDPDDDDVALMLVNSDGPVDGASDGNYIILIDGDRMKDPTFLRITMEHELGHMFGLVHLRKGNVGIMLKDPGTAETVRIGPLDVLQFCTLYKCPNGVN